MKAVISCGAEGAIVGSAFVKIVEDDLENPTRIFGDVSALAKKLKAATLRKTLKVEKAEGAID